MQPQVTHTMGWMIDTLQYAKGLEKAGVKREAAEFQAEALAQALEQAASTHLTTKDDLRTSDQSRDTKFSAIHQKMTSEFVAVRQEMASEFAAVRQEMASEFAAVRQEMTSEFAAVRQEMASMEIRLTDRMNRMFILTISILGGLITITTGLTTLLHFY